MEKKRKTGVVVSVSWLTEMNNGDQGNQNVVGNTKRERKRSRKK